MDEEEEYEPLPHEVVFPETDEDVEEKLDSLKLEEEPEEKVYTGKRGGQYVIRGGKKVYLRGDKKAEAKKTRSIKTPSKVNLKKYENHPLTTSVKAGMLLVNGVVNNTILKNRNKLTGEDLENTQIAEAVTYTVEHTIKVNQSSPFFVLGGALFGYAGRIAVLFISGSKQGVEPDLRNRGGEPNYTKEDLKRMGLI